VAHPKLAAYIKKHNWVNETGEYLSFPQNQTTFNGNVLQYLEFIQEVSIICYSLKLAFHWRQVLC